jgi:hypothetical protein
MTVRLSKLIDPDNAWMDAGNPDALKQIFKDLKLERQ